MTKTKPRASKLLRSIKPTTRLVPAGGLAAQLTAPVVRDENIISMFGDRFGARVADITAFFIYEAQPTSELHAALELVNPTKWSLLKIEIDDPVAEAFRVVKLPTLILHSEGVESARVFGDQHIIEMIGRVFDE